MPVDTLYVKLTRENMSGDAGSGVCKLTNQSRQCIQVGRTRQDSRKGCFLRMKACTSVPAVTQNKIMDLKMSIRSPVIHSDAYNTVLHPLLHISAHRNHKLHRQPGAMYCEGASIVFISVCAQCSRVSKATRMVAKQSEKTISDTTDCFCVEGLEESK